MDMIVGVGVGIVGLLAIEWVWDGWGWGHRKCVGLHCNSMGTFALICSFYVFMNTVLYSYFSIFTSLSSNQIDCCCLCKQWGSLHVTIIIINRALGR